MRSISWPNMFNTHTETGIVTDHDATVQNLKILLWTNKRELFGDPYFGAGIQRFLYDQNDAVTVDMVKDAIYTTIAQYMPQLTVERKDISIETDGVNMYATVKGINKINFETDLYNILLTNIMI